MLRFSRSDDSADRKLRIVDGTAAKAWLAGMSQPSSLASLGEITDVLLALGAGRAGDGAVAVAPQQRFVIAERVRGVVLPILHERGADEQLSALPLDDDFARHGWAVVDAAAALRDAYAWLVSQLSDAPPVNDASLTGVTLPGTAPPVAITGVGALQRALDVDAQLLTFVQRARWPVPTAFWERHCVLGQLVRDLDCQDVEVVDALRISITKTCRAAFVTPVLVALADPSARSAVELQVVRMAAQRWSARVGFRLERRSDGAATPARPVAHPGPTLVLGNFVLRLDTQSAMQSIDGRLDALAAGKTPREVGIGDSLRPPAARDLLLQLKQRWGAVAPGDLESPDRVWRASGGAQVMAVVGMPRRDARRDGEALGPARNGSGIYAYQRDQHRGITRSREAIESDRVARMLAGAETWTILAEAADAVRCVRKYARPRIGLQRLIGLKLGAGDGAGQGMAPFLLGWVEALQGTVVEGDDGRVRSGGGHRLRIRLAPGLPQIVDAAVDDVDLDCAFLLTPRVESAAVGRTPRPPAFIPMLSDSGADVVGRLQAGDVDPWAPVRASPRDHGLILPLATFRPQRIVKAGWRGVPVTLRLDELMMRGSDFDLVRFVVV